MKRVLLVACSVIVIVALAAWASVEPSNTRAWTLGQEVLPYATFNGSHVVIHQVRNFEWQKDGTAVPLWEDRSYNLDSLRTVWFILTPFSLESRGPAHTFLSFGFGDSQFVAVSVEARRETGEEYSLLKGALRQFEIMYVIGDERDLIRLRTNVRHDDVYVYPIRTTPAKMRALFVEMLGRANSLLDHPEFYNTIGNNCTTNILEHANRISPGRIPYGREVLLPGYADELAQRLGLIADTMPIENVRARYRVNEKALRYANDPLFSVRIREFTEDHHAEIDL